MKRFLSVVLACFLAFSAIGLHQQFTKSGHKQKMDSDKWLTTFIDSPGDIPSNSVYTFLCELITQKPETLTDTCADFGESVYKIKWKTWGVKGATGTGIYSINDCEPNCAEGTRREVPVQLRLDRVTTDGKRYLLNVLTIISVNATEPDGVYAIWDLSSFYREVPDMRSN